MAGVSKLAATTNGMGSRENLEDLDCACYWTTDTDVWSAHCMSN